MSNAMQGTLREKLEAVTETLGIVFPGARVTRKKEAAGWTFKVDGKGLRFTEDFLSAYDVDHILSMTHLAVAELRLRPASTIVHISAPAHLS